MFRLVEADHELQRLVAERWNHRAVLAESGSDQRRVVGVAADPHFDAALPDAHFAGRAHETLEQLAGANALVALAQTAAQQAVQRRGHDGELQVGIHLQRDRRGERVHVEEVDRLGDGVLDARAASVAVDQVGGLGIELVGEQQGGLVVAGVGDGDLADGPGVAAQADRIVSGAASSAKASRKRHPLSPKISLRTPPSCGPGVAT